MSFVNQNDELTKLESQFKTLNDELANAQLDNQRRATLSKERAKVEGLVLIYRQLVENERSRQEIVALLDGEADLDLKELYSQEINDLAAKQLALNVELEEILFPPDPRDKKPAFLEIRSGAGGQEASLFVGDLLRMYQNYALSKGWEFFINSSAVTDVGGYREVIAYVKGKDVFKILKYESGVHRVQRVPKTEGAGRIHTSTITVAVMPEADDVDININPSDLRIDVYRSSGAGGQHVNTTDSAVRITHIPTGVVVACQQERSQHKNKERALKELKSRILQAEQEKQLSEQTEKRKQQIGSGDRSEKIRTYNYPQNRITDHRIDLTLKRLDFIMEGDMDDLVNPMIAAERNQRMNLE